MEETSIALPDVSKRQTDDPHFAKNLKGTASHVGFKNVEVHISIILISYDLAYKHFIFLCISERLILLSLYSRHVILHTDILGCVLVFIQDTLVEI